MKRLVILMLLLVGCTSVAPARTVATPTPATTARLALIDQISKPSDEPGRWILAALFGSDDGFLYGELALEAVEAGTLDTPSSFCLEPTSVGAFSDHRNLLQDKLLDPVHPEAVKPVFGSPDSLRPGGPSADVKGWITWQVSLPSTGCHWTVSVTFGNGGAYAAYRPGPLAQWNLAGPEPTLPPLK